MVKGAVSQFVTYKQTLKGCEGVSHTKAKLECMQGSHISLYETLRQKRQIFKKKLSTESDFDGKEKERYEDMSKI